MKEYDKKTLRVMERSKVRKLYLCPRCSVPRLLARLFKWDSGGVIRLRYINTNLRFVFLENDLLNEILEMLTAHFGEEEVYEMARHTEKASSCGYVGMLFGSSSKYLKPFSFIARYTRMFPVLLELNVTLLGYGATNVIGKLFPHPASVVRNPYNQNLFLADVQGCYLVAREREGKLKVDTISEKYETYLYSAESIEDRVPGICDQYRIETPPLKKVAEPYHFNVCPKCKTPEQAGLFLWDPRMGVVVHKDTGKRIILWPCYALEHLLSSLVEQLGEEAGLLITNTVKRYQRDSILHGGIGFTNDEKLEFVEADRKGRYTLLLKHLACMGFGHGEVELEENKVKITMTNALIPTVTAGMMTGMVEAMEERDTKVSWEEGTGVTVYALELS